MIQIISIFKSKCSVRYFALIFRQYELFISEYLVKIENHLATDGLLKKGVVESVNSWPSNLFAWWKGIALDYSAHVLKGVLITISNITVMKEMLILKEEKRPLLASKFCCAFYDKQR